MCRTYTISSLSEATVSLVFGDEDDKEEVDDIEVSYTTTSTIKGEWEVIFGDLYFTYNLSTLDVAITNVDYQLSENADFSTKMDYAEAAIGMALLGQELINKDELTEDIRKNAYQSFYEDYESSNNEGDGSYYEDLKIGNNVMSPLCSKSVFLGLYTWIISDTSSLELF